MSRKLRALGLTVLALCGLTALMATSAQANWLENGVAIAVNKEVKAAAHTEGRLLIAALNFEIRCPELDAEGLKLIAGTKEATGKVKFLKCEGFQISTGVLQKNCTPNSPGQAAGNIVAGGKALDVKLATERGVAASLKELILLEPNAGEPFTTIELPELCALAETSKVTGTLVAECGRLEPVNTFTNEECSVAKEQHLLRQGLEVLWKGTSHTEEVKDSLKFGENAAKVDGIAVVELASGKPWSGDA